MTQYIDKDALVAEIEKLIANGKEKCQQSKENNALGSYIAWSEHIATCGKILSYINTLEVKEFKVEPKFSVGDKINMINREEEDYTILTITSINMDEKCYICNQGSVIDFDEEREWYKIEPKPTWSEEDEERYVSCLLKLGTGNLKQPETINTVWLRSLKERVQLV